MSRTPLLLSLLLGLGAMVVGCGTAPESSTSARPTVVVSTTLLGDVVEHLVGGAAAVRTVVPAGADPHSFSPSARDVDELRRASAVVLNGAGFEHTFSGILDAIDGEVPVFEAIDGVATLPRDHDGGVDPHFFGDPSRMAQAAAGITAFLTDTIPQLDASEVTRRSRAYVWDLRALDSEVESLLAPIAPSRRALVTNHDVLGYFADRYGFERLGTIVSGGGTEGTAGARNLAHLAAVVEQQRLPAIFADESAPTRLADALAGEAGGVRVVPLYGEALGPPGSPADTYVAMVRSNALRIAGALG